MLMILCSKTMFTLLLSNSYGQHQQPPDDQDDQDLVKSELLGDDDDAYGEMVHANGNPAKIDLYNCDLNVSVDPDG